MDGANPWKYLHTGISATRLHPTTSDPWQTPPTRLEDKISSIHDGTATKKKFRYKTTKPSRTFFSKVNRYKCCSMKANSSYTKQCS